MNKKQLLRATELLRKLVSIPSFSGEEEKRSSYLEQFFHEKGIVVERIGNNLVVRQPHPDRAKPTLMLNSHLDTVQPASTYSFDPFIPPVSDTYVYGLGSNDAGASVAAMTEAFLHFYDKNLPFNLILALSTEEENSGAHGMRMLWEKLRGEVDMAIIGEPTGMRAAVAERGLLVIDGESKGISGHAAREEGVNALYVALEDIDVLRSVKFPKISSVMGEVKLTVTQIHAGTQHNVVPDRCNFVVDIRPTEMYTNQEIMDMLQPKTKSTLQARSLVNRSSATPTGHPLYQCAKRLGIETYTSPTTSDWMRITCPALKMGPGESARSHQADEYILIKELGTGIHGYIEFITQLKTN
ncbi:M20/M25/M40 family metallo-hydrolase [Proteiniphilum sp. UBA1028]|jgi:acetylornithine deacetylase|uniref:M20/M25/M40 family metallo-hydrolase n=1 Tax=Proteiniphilum sp. UBA1028 TaxID=1947251 RepID=UPI000E9B52B6|nr:M20/M25/M40 family metallo-hydrolase [Proteiniphilum sp. UBA1028]HBG58898.1 acetylornithine deacetylase [Porphyromonadaceae bacterium]